ncbi:MAG: hypothetical protein U0414_23490 [Polyangiaceae bacterium]
MNFTSDVFLPLPASSREAWLPHYLTYLRDREGRPDLDRRTLPKRERFLASLPPVAPAEGLVDQATFDRNVRRRAPDAGLDARALWALAVAKANRAERYGIEMKLRVRGFEPDGAEDPYTFVEIQELYHTRIFVEILAAIGVKAEILAPAGLTRGVVTAIGCLPHALSDVVALAAELAGVTAFRLLLEESRTLFADAPAVRDRIALLLGSVVVDEVGHVRFLSSRLGPARLAIARRILPLVARGMVDDIPEIVSLFGRDPFFQAVQSVDLDAADASLPDRSPLFDQRATGGA